jgi:hypothetical protein
VADGAGDVRLAYAMHRPIDFGSGCLECAGAIDPEALRQQRYLDDPDGDNLVDPSVITLNSAAVALPMLDFQFAATGMFAPPDPSGRAHLPRPRTRPSRA